MTITAQSVAESLVEAKSFSNEPTRSLKAEECYWAVLNDLPGHLSDYALLAAFEQWLPVPIDDIEAGFVRLAEGAVIACGVEHTRLQQLIEQLGDDCPSMCPEGVPEFVREVANEVDMAGLMEFRRGRYAPSLIQCRQRQQHVGALLLVIVACGLLAGGFMIRASNANTQALAASTATSALVDAALGPARGASANLDPAQRLDASLRLHNQTKQLGELAPIDVAPTYADLLAVWPSQLHVQVSGLTIDVGSIRIDATLETSEDAENLVRQLDDGLAEWTVGSRNIRRSREGFQLTLVFVTTAQGAAP